MNVSNKKSKAKLGVKKSSEPLGKPVAAVERALSILDAFRKSSSPLWLHEISEHTGLYKSTVLRLLETMQSKGYILRISDGRYQLGAVLFELGSAYQASFQLEHLVKPVLESLSKITGESATFYMRAGDMRQCMWRIESQQPVRDVLRSGQMFPIGNTSAGQVFTEYDKELEKIEIKNFKSLIKESSKVGDDQTASIASPVFDAKGFVGALAISGPEARFTNSAINEMKKELAKAVETLNKQLGYFG